MATILSITEDHKQKATPELYREIREHLDHALICWMDDDDKGVVDSMDRAFKCCAKLGFRTFNKG